MSEVVRIYLPWLMSAITVYTMFLAGNKSSRAWMFGLGNQALWLTWIIATQAWGLLPMNLALWIVYGRNHWKWAFRGGEEDGDGRVSETKQSDEAVLKDLEKRLARIHTLRIFEWLRETDRHAFEAIEMMAMEVIRQREEEGWSAAHDDEHHEGEMARAAACYADLAGADIRTQWRRHTGVATTAPSHACPPSWPWSSQWWKPKNVNRNLIRAGALLASEHGRYMRAWAETYTTKKIGQRDE